MLTLNIENIKRVLLVFIGLIIITMGYYIWLFNKGEIHQEKVPVLDTTADVVATDFTVSEKSLERTLWKLRAKEAEVYNAEKKTRLKDVEVKFFNEDGKNILLTSDRGLKDDETGNIIAAGNVRVISLHENTTLKTEELIYDAARQKIRTDEDRYVIIEQEDVVISGYGLESDLSLSKPRILRDITTSYTVEEKNNE